ncbi:MAG: FtsX-like permease family protein [Paracoccaceae bacterium]|nr:FtsX-like permease family protein [Paracoccaceae bacterium]MDG1736726.1 FtsX-like permease family protein [Paracoccaceae bacterium]MDG2257557.1 FtsX-like permease family protein [Paracoccaceae bacterium]
MSLHTAAKFARRELRGGLKGFRVFLACLTFGVAAIAAIGTVRSSIETGLQNEGAALLGGDAEIEFTYRFAFDREMAWMQDTATNISEIADFRSLVVVYRDGELERGLTQIKAIDTAYPLVGSVELSPDIPLAQALATSGGIPGTVMERVLADRLGLSPGDEIRLGDKTFRFSAFLLREPDNGGGSFGLGPRTIVYKDALEGSGLLLPGTLFSSKYRLTFPDGTDLEAVKTEALDAFYKSGLRWQDARAGAPGVAYFVERLGAFLILVGLSGLAVGGVGVSAAVRTYLAGKTDVIATLRTLGADQKTIFQTYFLQIAALSLIGITLGLIIGTAMPLAIAPLLENVLPIPAVFTIHAAPLIEAALYGTLTALIFTLWPLAKTGDIRAAALFRDALAAGRFLPPWRFSFAILILIALLIATAAFYAGNIFLTLWTAAGVLAALIVLSLAAWFIRQLAKRLSHLARGRLALRSALNATYRGGSETTSVMVSIGLGLSVLAAIGQVDGNMRSAIADQLPDIAPSYFFVDIQSSQMPEFLERVNGDDAITKIESAPMLRGIITQINDRPASEVAGEHWVIQGDRGLTYSANKPTNATLTAGEWWPEDYKGAPLVSFSAQEAEEMGLTLGDTLTINVLGRDVTATITSFRSVDFRSAGMGFILSMNPTALQGAPHSHIATVYAAENQEARILRDLANAFPNITAIRVRDAIDLAGGILKNIAAATSYGAGITLFTGLLVLIGAIAAGERARSYEAAILKTLGASRRQILSSFAQRSAITGLSAGLVALGFGIAAGWGVCTFVFDLNYAINWPSALGIVIGGVGSTLIAGLIFASRSLNVSPSRTLRGRQ